MFKLRQRFFANLMTQISPKYNEATHEEKMKLFSKLKTQVSQFPELQEQGSLRVLEIGAGSGPNLKYFSKCHLTVVDPNLFFEEEFRKKVAEYPQITLEGYIGAYVEDLKEIIKDNSIDAVVVTAVGCSVNDIQKFHKEVLRVLVPGGKFYYLEHIMGEYGSWSYWKQKALALFGIWSFFGCNCHFDRDLDKQIMLAGFGNIDQKLFQIDTLLLIFHFMSPHVAGIATK